MNETAPPPSAACPPAKALPRDGLPNPERMLAFATLAMATAMAVLDGAIVNVALPTIAHELSINNAASVWIVNAFQLAVTVSLLPLAALGAVSAIGGSDRPGLALFTLASLACALAPTFPVLTVARAVQGLGAAGIMSVNIALVRFIYPSSRLGRGVGNMALVVAVCSAGSSTVAAAVLSVASWRWLFLINVPIGAIALVTAARNLPETPVSQRQLDPMSILLNALTFGFLITGINSVGEPRTQSAGFVELAAAVAVGAVFVRRQLYSPSPAAARPPSRPVFALSLATSITSFAAQSLSLVALPFYFEDSRASLRDCDRPPHDARPLATALIAPVAGRLADRFVPGLLGSAGLLVMAAGLALVAPLGADANAPSLVRGSRSAGPGFGFFQSPNNRLIIGSAPPERSGGASGLQSSGRLIGQSFGAALMAVAFGRWPEHATTIALWAAAGLSLAGACASGLRKA